MCASPGRRQTVRLCLLASASLRKMQTTSPMSHFLLRFSWTFSLFLTHSLIMRDHLSDAMFTGHRSLPRSGYLCVLDVAIVHGQSPVADVMEQRRGNLHRLAENLL